MSETPRIFSKHYINHYAFAKADSRKLIDPAAHVRDRTEELREREKKAGVNGTRAARLQITLDNQTAGQGSYLGTWLLTNTP